MVEVAVKEEIALPWAIGIEGNLASSLPTSIDDDERGVIKSLKLKFLGSPAGLLVVD